MILGIDASRCGVKFGTGVEAYSTAIVKAILRELSVATHPKFDEVVLYTPRRAPDGVLRSAGGVKYSFVHERVIPFPRMWTQVRLSAEMIHEEPDVLFVPSHVLPLVHAEKSVVTIHDTAFVHFPDAYSYFQRKYLTFTTWLAVREAKKIIVPSEATKSDLMRSFCCPEWKIAVVPHGFEASARMNGRAGGDGEETGKKDDVILREFGLNQHSKYILYVGRLEEKKNLVRLVRAFAKFRESHPEWRLILAGGRGFGFEKIFGEVEKHDMWESVMMPGYVTNEERDVLYRHCQFVAFVSLAEGFGFPVLEAAVKGKPVLASDIAALREVGGEVTSYCDPLNEESIFDGLITMASGKILDDRGEELAKLVAKYSWEKAGKATLHVLEEVL